MYMRWHSEESVEIPSFNMARVLLEIPVVTEGKQHTIHLPFVVDLEDLVDLTLILTRNGYHYSVQPVETEVD